MAFELHHSSVQAFLVPNHTKVNVKLRGDSQLLDGWEYRGFDDSKQFILLTKNDTLRWVPLQSISYIEQTIHPE